MTQVPQPSRPGIIDFESPLAFGEKLTPFVAEKIDAMNLRYVELDDAERDEWLRRIVSEIVDGTPPVAGEARHEAWEKGWGHHREMLAKDPSWRSLVPGYFGKFPVVRWQGRLIKPTSEMFEYHMLEAVQWFVADKFLRNAPAIYELGCGTGHNLLRLKMCNPDAALIGMDWAEASNRLLRQVADVFGDPHGMWPVNFDLFRPTAIETISGSALFSCAALEQIGTRFEPLLQWMLAQKPSIVVHIEPITELLDGTKLLDYLSMAYCRKRGYLANYYTRLRELEAEGRITIRMARDSGVGSLFIQGYQCLVWSPC